MDLTNLYEFSKFYAPPKTDIRQATIYSCMGNDKSATMIISHCLPEDVSIDELNFYPQSWIFMDLNSLLFYSYSVFKFKDDPLGNQYWNPRGVDHYFYALEYNFTALVNINNIQILFDSIKIMWEKDNPFFDLEDCPNIKCRLAI